MSPKNYLDVETVSDKSFDRWHKVSIARDQRNRIAFLFNNGERITHHIGDNVSINLLFFVRYISIVYLYFETNALGDVP